MSKKITIFILCFALQLFILNGFRLFAQCGTTISSFPYFENFETSPAWTVGGANSDWTWGTPAHPILNTAGGGTKSWCIGGLTGSFYNYSEDAWITSPCFDFTNLNYPWISFKIFWEDEWKYDGMVLEYSTNNGSTWSNVGAYGDPVDCMNDNWYDYNNITWLTTVSPKHGWTGRTQPTAGSCQGGHGSLGWVIAKHCLSNLANQPSVIFRFHFGAGTNCNSFDGIAIDDVLIDNAPPNVAGFTYTCSGGTTLSFTNTSTPCPTGFAWDFGDPTSGISNTSTQTNPSHTFSGTGLFNVKLIAQGPCNAPDTIVIPVNLLAVTTSVVNTTCGASNGSATATATGGTGTYSYSWQPGGATTQTITGISAATYTVTVTSGCTTTATAVVTDVSSSNMNIAVTIAAPITCLGSSNGSIHASVSGGTQPYSINWNTGDIDSTISNLSAGNYCIFVTDSLGCMDSSCILLSNPPPIAVNTQNQTICIGQSISVSATATGGIAPYTYTWNNGAFVGQTFSDTPVNDTVYTVVASDSSGCISVMDTSYITVYPPLSVIATDSTNVCEGQSITLNASASGGNGNYTYTWMPGNINGMNLTSTATAPITYTVSVTDGCTVQAAQALSVVSVLPQPTTSFSANKQTDCAPLCVQFTDNSSLTGGSISAWQWAFGDNANATSINPTHCYNTPGAYNVSLTTVGSNGCSSTLLQNNYITVFPIPEALIHASIVTTSIYEPEIDFSDASTIASGIIANYLWNFGDSVTSINNAVAHTYTGLGNFNVQLIVTSDKGCRDTANIVVEISNGFTFYAPNAFTPNHDSLNDVFIPKGTGWDADNYQFDIFDRWGNHVFGTTNTTLGWDGKNKENEVVLFDVFVWQVTVIDTSRNEHHFMGTVTVSQ